MNTSVLIFGLLMCVVTVSFWFYELLPFLKALKGLKYPKTDKGPVLAFTTSITFIGASLSAIIKLWSLVLDMSLTFFITGTLFSGGGLVSGIIGLTISNLISLGLIFAINYVKSDS